jgi:hypothetical protein
MKVQAAVVRGYYVLTVRLSEEKYIILATVMGQSLIDYEPRAAEISAE